MLSDTLGAMRDFLDPVHLDWIQVEVSARCVGSCCYCPTGRDLKRARGPLMTWETFERLEPSFALADLVFLQGWGEPLLHPHFWEMVRRAREAESRVGFTTNGLFLNEENRRALLESGVDVLGASVAGATPATHDRFREGCPLEVVERHLRALRKEKAGDAAPEVHVAYLLMAGNADEVGGVVEHADAWGATDIVVSHLSLILDRALEEESLLAHPASWPRVQERLEAAREQAAERGIRLSYRAPASVAGLLGCPENVLRSCFVSVGGDVSPCVMAHVGLPTGATHRFRGREEPLATLTFGNVGERSLTEIWRGRAAREFRSSVAALIHAGRPAGAWPTPCRGCYKLREGKLAE